MQARLREARRRDMLNRRDVWLIGLAFASTIAYVLGASLLGERGFPLDDAWIHQTYARNLAQTGQWAFVPGEPSSGSTAPLYTLLLAVGYWLNIPFLVWTTLVGGAALAVAGVVAARLAETLLPEVRRIGWWGGLATVFAWHLLWAAASGMETMLFATLTLLVVWLAWREANASDTLPGASWRRGMLLGLVGAAATVTRPEGVGLLGLAGLLMWIARPGDGRRRLGTWSAGVTLGFLVGIAPVALLNLSLGGSILPNTAAAKQAENAPLLAQSYFTRLGRMTMPLLAGGQVMLVPGLVAALWVFVRRSLRDRRAVLWLLPAVWGVALIALYAWRLPAPYQHGRYVIPALPHLLLFGVAGTAYLMRWGERSLTGRVLTRALTGAAVVLTLFFWQIGLDQFGRDVQIIESEMVVTAQWLDEHLTPDQLLAVHDIGAVGYYAPRPILDLAGLVSPEVVPLLNNADALWDLMEARGVRYLMAFPDQIPGSNLDDPRLCRVFTSAGTWAPLAGGHNMAVYALAWDRSCGAQ